MSRLEDEGPTGTLFDLLRMTREDQGKSLERIERQLERIDTRTQAATASMQSVLDTHSGQIGGLLRWQGAQERAQEQRTTSDRAWRRVHAPALVVSAATLAAGVATILAGHA